MCHTAIRLGRHFVSSSRRGRGGVRARVSAGTATGRGMAHRCSVLASRRDPSTWHMRRDPLLLEKLFCLFVGGRLSFHRASAMARDLAAAFSPLRSISDASPNSTAPSLVMGVLVAPHALAQRQALRQTWMRSACVLASKECLRCRAPEACAVVARLVAWPYKRVVRRHAVR